jgi:hypothetical protein
MLVRKMSSEPRFRDCGAGARARNATFVALRGRSSSRIRERLLLLVLLLLPRNRLWPRMPLHGRNREQRRRGRLRRVAHHRHAREEGSRKLVDASM